MRTSKSLKRKRVKAFLLALQAEYDEAKEDKDELLEEGMVYIQMRLPVEDISKEFEDSLKQKIEHNIIRANIREAQKEDLEIVVGIYNRSWLTSQTPFRAMSIDDFIEIFEDPNCIILIGKVYGIDGGFIILDFEGNNNEIGIIAGLGILPRFQRKGLGTVLGMASWNYFKEKGVKELRCEVYKDNKVSEAFIKGLGFKEFGEPKVYRAEDFDFDD
ncbi:MAG: GNAT family N-acetyltransferase [Promethearchaeota archaeon]